ncbi:hypothetical protein [Paenibacillus cineris]|nr:hypothetical protein [Paenibacillus cineris]
MTNGFRGSSAASGNGAIVLITGWRFVNILRYVMDCIPTSKEQQHGGS